MVSVLTAGGVQADTALVEDFSTGAASDNWSGTNLNVSQASGSNTSFYLGQLRNDTLTLSLTGLDLPGGGATPNAQGQHAFVTVSYDLFIIGGWTGNNENTAETAHTFAFDSSSSVDATSHRLTTTFSNLPVNILPEKYQAFPYDSVNDGYYSQPGGKGAYEINTLGFSGAASGYDDAVYRLAGGRNQSFTFDHSVDDLILDFSDVNLPEGATWGLTNVRVATGGVFNWKAMTGDGLNGGWEVGDHWINPDSNMSQSPGADDLAQFTEAGNYSVSIHNPTSVGFLHLSASTDNASEIQFNTIGHPLTLTAGNYSNVSLAVADGTAQTDTLFIFNSNNDVDSDFNGVVNAETVGVARGVNAHGTLTLDGYLDPAQPGTTDNPLGNVILNVQREMAIGDARYHDETGHIGVGTLNILHGAIVNSGVGGGSASSQPADGNTTGATTYVDGTVNVDDQGIWNQTGTIWSGVIGLGTLNVTAGSQINIFDLPYAGHLPAIGGTLMIGGFVGANGAVNVKDPDSQINVGGIQVGTSGIDALLTIDNLAAVNGSYVSIGSTTTGFTGPSGDAFVDVTHQGLLKVTTPAADGRLVVGDAFDGRMTLGLVTGNNGSLFSTGQATVDFAVIGRAAGVTGLVDVEYAQAADLHSLFTVNKTLTVGGDGQGTLGMNGGGVTVLLGQDMGGGPIGIVGDQIGSHGLITMFGGAGSDTWAQGSTLDASAGGVILGNLGFGRLEIYNGGQTFAKSIVMAQQAGSSAELVVDGEGADFVHTTLLWISDTSTGLTVGQGGTSSTATVLNGAFLDTFRATVGGQGGDLGPGTVTVQDLRDPATLVNHEIGSLWLVHGQAVEGATVGGTLDIGGAGLGNPLGGAGSVTIGSGGKLGVDGALQLGKNGRLAVTGGAVTVGTADPLLMDATPNSLHIVPNASLPGVLSTVSGGGVITADVTIHSGGNLGPNSLSGSTAGTLSIVGTLHELPGGNISTCISAPSSGNYDTFALLDATLSTPAGTATLGIGAGITLIGIGSYQSPQVGDHMDVITAASVTIGTLNLSFLNLPSSDWYYGVVSIPGGQALRIQYGVPVVLPGAVSIHGTVRHGGLPAVGVLVSAGAGLSAITDANGQYTLSVPLNSSGTLTPSASGFLFDPQVRTFTNLTADLSTQDFLMSPLVAPPLVITKEGTLRRVTWTAILGVTYQPQTSINLMGWNDLGPPIPGANAPVSFTFQTTADPKRFFRVRAVN